MSITPSIVLGIRGWEVSNYSSYFVLFTSTKISPEIRLAFGYYFQFKNTQRVIPFISIFGLAGIDAEKITGYPRELTDTWEWGLLPITYNLLQMTFRVGAGLEAGILFSLGADNFLSFSISDTPPFLGYTVTPRNSVLSEEATSIRIDSHIIKIRFGLTVKLGK